MKFTPTNSKVYKVTLSPKENAEKAKKSKKDHKDINANLKFENQLYLNSSDKKLFRLRYLVTVDVENMVDIDLEYDFDFSAENEVDESLASSLVIRSEIPNYVFPYIKSYLEHFLMMSGYGYIPFPYVDFLSQPIPEKE